MIDTEFAVESSRYVTIYRCRAGEHAGWHAYTERLGPMLAADSPTQTLSSCAYANPCFISASQKKRLVGVGLEIMILLRKGDPEHQVPSQIEGPVPEIFKPRLRDFEEGIMSIDTVVCTEV